MEKTFFTPIVILFLGLFYYNSQGFAFEHPINIVSLTDSTLQLKLSPADSLKRDLENGTIYTRVNSEGKIEIKRKELDKIPAERQEAIKQDPNFKVIED